MPKPMRAALTGLTGSDGLFDGPGPVGLFGFFSGVLPGSFETLALGRLLLGLLALDDAGALSFGRDVKNAPRTSPSSCGAGAAVPIATAHAQTVAKRRTLNRIAIS
jgi:hypothetical protein